MDEASRNVLMPFAGWDFSGTAWEGKSEDTPVLFNHKTGKQITLGDFWRVDRLLEAQNGQ